MARLRVGASDNTTSGAASAGASSKTRRTHRKSRNGCSECKRRHIRCDEGRPACTNCTIAERTCSFPGGAATSSAPRPARASPAPQPQPQPSAPSVTATSPSPSPLPVPSPSAASSSASLGPLLHHHQQQQPPVPPRAQNQNQNQNQNQVHLPSYHHLLPPPQHPLSPALSVGDTNESSHFASRSSSSSHVEPHHHHQHQPQIPSLDKLPIPCDRPSTSSLSPSAIPHSLPLPLPPPSALSIPPPATFTAHHLMLLHHAETDMADSFLGPGQAHLTITIAIRNASAAPYLIDQVLALSAMHLIFQQQQQRQQITHDSVASLHHQATELQTRALASFTRETGILSTSEEDMTNAVPRFLYSALLSVHVLADCLSHDPVGPGFHTFVDRFVECIALHSGVRTIIRPDWYTILTSELNPMLSAITLANPENIEKPGTECAPLETLMNTSNMNPASVEACRTAIKSLQWAFNWQNNYEDPHTTYAGSAFVIVLSDGFTDVLREHKPEALIIMAYYGVLLHRARRFWVFGSSGARIVRAVAQNLGSLWQDAIKWPLEIIETEVD